MHRALMIATALSLAASPALAAPCKDAKGKFIKCPPAVTASVVKGKDGKCRFASGPKKGQFTKCV
ncbi:hypothetical protein [Sandarakinorhabdus oryzae]|uniref:hypothetical protein n=1 Tax=Sandarakinorhabdus oryzae TaxID=2675220 RepID=UPI0012E16DD5|nr:hypothetical protein [Sandarakinorhabdus oryzae]